MCVCWGGEIGIVESLSDNIYKHTHTSVRTHRRPAWVRSGSRGSNSSCNARRGSLTLGCLGPWRASSMPEMGRGWWGSTVRGQTGFD